MNSWFLFLKNKFNNRSLRAKLIIVIVSTCLLGDLLIINVWSPWNYKKQVETLLDDNKDLLEAVSDSIIPFLIQQQYGAIYESLNSLVKRQNRWKSLLLIDQSGNQIYPEKSINKDNKTNSLTLAHEINYSDNTLGKLILELDMEGVNKTIQVQNYIVIAILTFGFIFIALILSYLIEILVGRRTRELIKVTDRFSHGDFDVALPFSSSDEIGRLVDAFDKMRISIVLKEKSLIEARDVAESANHTKSRFLATMSHEIRTPLNGMLGMAEALRLTDNSDEKKIEYLNLIRESGNNLLSILNEILDFSKLESDQVRIELVETDLNNLINESMSQFKELANNKNSRLEYHSELPNRFFLTDPLRIKQIMSNLISNAIKFTENGLITIRAEYIEYSLDNSFVVISVVDTGIGIKKEKLSVLFQPFTQVDNSNTRKYGGTGLGLSIVKKLVHIMGGEINVQSEFGLGTCFSFTLPIKSLTKSISQENKNIISQKNKNNKSVSNLHLFSGTVLVAEDNDVNTKVISIFLKKLGFEVIIAENGQMALEKYEKNKNISAIFMDIQMPIMDGITATVKIREYEKMEKRMPVFIVALTGNVYEEDKKKCINAGMNAVLAKPLTIDNLQDTLLKKFKPI